MQRHLDLAEDAVRESPVSTEEETSLTAAAIKEGADCTHWNEAMKRRRGYDKPVIVEHKDNIETKELSWQGYDTVNLSTCVEAYELFDEVVKLSFFILSKNLPIMEIIV